MTMVQLGFPSNSAPAGWYPPGSRAVFITYAYVLSWIMDQFSGNHGPACFKRRPGVGCLAWPLASQLGIHPRVLLFNVPELEL